MNGTAFDVPPPGAGTFTTICATTGLMINEYGIGTTNCVVVSTDTSDSGVPLKITLVSLNMNPDPVMFRRKLNPPAVAPVGERELIAGAELFTVSGSEFEIPPPGLGFRTVIGAGFVCSADQKAAQARSRCGHGRDELRAADKISGAIVPGKLNQRREVVNPDPVTVRLKLGPLYETCVRRD